MVDMVKTWVWYCDKSQMLKRIKSFAILNTRTFTLIASYSTRAARFKKADKRGYTGFQAAVHWSLSGSRGSYGVLQGHMGAIQPLRLLFNGLSFELYNRHYNLPVKS